MRKDLYGNAAVQNLCMPRDRRDEAARYESASTPYDHVRCSDVEPKTERPNVAIIRTNDSK